LSTKIVILTPHQEVFLTELFALCQKHRQTAGVEVFSTGLQYNDLCIAVLVRVAPSCLIDRCDLDLAYIAEE
jgi:hypothetical protein